MNVSDHPLILANKLTKAFNGIPAVDQIDLEIQPGTIFGFIGPSGSGKTTSIRLFTGASLPTSGEVLVFGISPDHFTRRYRERIGYMPQHFALYPDLTVRENMGFAASLYGIGWRRGRRIGELLDLVELHSHRHKRARELSGGMQRRLSLAATLIHRPDLIFLDEPTAAIDPILRRKFWDAFKDLRDNGATLFITTQYVSEAAYCDLVGIMQQGKLLAVDTPDRLRKRAIGGDVIHLRTVSKFEHVHLDTLRRLPFVVKVERASESEVWVTVKKASTAIPRLVEWSKENNLITETIREYLPPFDDVFVTLIERNSNGR